MHLFLVGKCEHFHSEIVDYCYCLQESLSAVICLCADVQTEASFQVIQANLSMPRMAKQADGLFALKRSGEDLLQIVY